MSAPYKVESRSRSPSPPGNASRGSPSSPYRYKAFSSFSYGKSPNLKLNEKGGVLITRDEIENALRHLASDKKNGRISLVQLKKKLGAFFPEINAKDFKFLFHNRKDISVSDLTEMLLVNELTQFDPMVEAYKAYDPRGTGSISKESIERAFAGLGFPQLSDADLDVLLSVADTDNDGKVSFEDFRAILENKSLYPAEAVESDKDNAVVLDNLEIDPES